MYLCSAMASGLLRSIDEHAQCLHPQPPAARISRVKIRRCRQKGSSERQKNLLLGGVGCKRKHGELTER